MQEAINYHIITLTPDQQASLRFCMFHWISLKASFCLNAVLKTPTKEHLKDASDNLIKSINSYDIIVNQWPMIQDRKLGGKSQIFYFDLRNFIILKQSVNHYNRETAVIMIGEDKTAMIELQIESIQKIITESSKYTYTYPEIQMEMRRNK